MSKKKLKQKLKKQHQKPSRREFLQDVDRQARRLAHDYVRGVRLKGFPPPVWFVHFPKIEGLEPYLKAQLDSMIASRAIDLLEQKGHRPMVFLDSDI